MRYQAIIQPGRPNEGWLVPEDAEVRVEGDAVNVALPFEHAGDAMQDFASIDALVARGAAIPVWQGMTTKQLAFINVQNQSLIDRAQRLGLGREPGVGQRDWLFLIDEVVELANYDTPPGRKVTTGAGLRRRRKHVEEEIAASVG